ncbi:Swi3-domain-containing protein [Agrocybe pediades]|nr:Swi3-domain-containing protein [Agrocybe pediades]
MDSTSLDSIWDEPAIINSPKRAEPAQDSDGEGSGAHRAPKRSRQTLFLADSDDDLELSPSNRVTRKAPPIQHVDVDALFADIDDDDDLMNFDRVPDRVDEAELARKAEAEARRRMPTLTPHQIMPSSSPVRDAENGAGNKRSKGKQAEEDGDEKKARRRLAKLDENRLLGPSGFPQLIKMTKDFRVKGKGYEATDLNRLLQTYQYWTHQLYPKTQFRDTVERIEKLCHSRRMNVSLSVWRDEAHGKPTQQRDGSDDEENDNEEEGNADQSENARMDTDDPILEPPRSSPSRISSRATSPPASGPSSEGDMPSRPPGGNGSNPQDASNREEDEQEDFWRSLDEFNDDMPDPPPAPVPAANLFADDDDMWDIIDEVERDSADKRSLPASGTDNPVVPSPPIGNPPDDDLDDMYL